MYLLGTQKCSFTLEMCNLLFKPGGLPHAYSPPFSLSPSDGSIQSKYLFKSDRLGWVRAAKVGFLVSYFSSDFSFRNELPKFDHQQREIEHTHFTHTFSFAANSQVPLLTSLIYRHRLSPKIFRQVREGPGEFLFYHSDDYTVKPGLARISCSSLADELRNGKHRLAIARRLSKPLTPQKQSLVEEFATLNIGKIFADDAPPVSLIMAARCQTSGPTAAAFDRLSLSQFVAMMLAVVGVAVSTNVPGEYAAADRKGRALGAPILLKMKNLSSSTSITSSTTTSTTTTLPLTRKVVDSSGNCSTSVSCEGSSPCSSLRFSTDSNGDVFRNEPKIGVEKAGGGVVAVVENVHAPCSPTICDVRNTAYSS